MSNAQLERRIAALEAEVAELRQQLHAGAGKSTPWWERIAGTIPDDEMTRRAEKAGRTYRKSTKPASKKKGKAKRAATRYRSHEPVAAR